MPKKIWWSALLVIFVLIGILSANSYADVVINEVYYDPEGTDTGNEWVELYNNSDNAVSLDAYCLYASGEHYVFNTFTLGARAYVVVHWNAEGADSNTDLYTGTTDWSNMGNTSASVALWTTHDSHTQDTIVDFMEYGAGGQTFESTAVSAGIWLEDNYAPDVESGHSLEYDGSGNMPNDWLEQAVPTPSSDNSLPVKLSKAIAKLSSNGIILEWRTESQIENAGFNIYRIEDNEFLKINSQLIQGAGTTSIPQEYRFIDEIGNSDTCYLIENVSFDGQTSRSKQIKVTKTLIPEKKVSTLWSKIKSAD